MVQATRYTLRYHVCLIKKFRFNPVFNLVWLFCAVTMVYVQIQSPPYFSQTSMVDIIMSD